MHSIFKKIMGALNPDSGASEPAIPDGRHALAALLVRAARASEVYDDRQIAQIDAILARRFDLPVPDADKLRLNAADYEQSAGDTVHLTRAIKEIVPLDERPGLLEDLWCVILADGGRHENEDGLMRLVSNLLGLADRESAFARQKVMARNAGIHTA